MESEVSPEYDVRYVISGTPGRDTHLDAINAAAAYARGATGEGQKILVVDTGIKDDHREFAGTDKITFSAFDPAEPYSETMSRREASHGTAVASIAAGNRDGGSDLNMHGVAFEAGIHLAYRELLDTSDPDFFFRRFLASDFTPGDDTGIADLYDRIAEIATNQKAFVANLSFGISGTAISQYTEGDVRRLFPKSAAALVQTGVDDADKTIFVFAAGNDNGENYDRDVAHDGRGGSVPADSPGLINALGAYFPELQTHTLAVVALDQDGGIADYSNRCGIAKNFCIAAPGSAIIHANGDDEIPGDYGINSGTSFAAPIVSGSLALLRDYFDGQVGNTELVDRLLATANREGIYADSNTYGHGLVDLDAATRPVGMLMTGLHDDPASRPLDGGIGVSGGAFGTAMQQALAGVEIAGFDSLDAPFFHSATASVTQAARRSGATTIGDSTHTTPDMPLFASAWAGLDGRNAGAKLSLTTDAGEVTGARLALDNGWWFSHGQHGGRELGLYSVPMTQPFNRPLTFAAPYLSLVRDGPGVGWSRGLSGGGARSGDVGFTLMHGAPQFDGWEKPGGARGFGALLDYRVIKGAGGAGLSLQAGAVQEADGLLGARAHDAFGEVRGETAFAGVNGVWVVGGSGDRGAYNPAASNPAAGRWQVLASAFVGSTRAQVGGDGYLRGADNILSSAFSIGASRDSQWRRGDWLSLRLSQPLRVESGDLQLRVPAGRTKYREVIHETHDIPLAPAGRTLQIDALYRLPVAGGALQTILGLEHQPQHDRRSDVEPYIKVSFERRF